MLDISYAAEAGSAGVVSEAFSLVLIIAAFFTMVYLSLKVRSVRTFQFEMLFFTVVLVLAEVPRTLYSLGLVQLDWLSTAGLEIHSLSMVILSGFVAYRTYGFFRGRPVVGLKGSYEQVLTSSLESALTKVFGQGTARAVEFYVDSNLALSDPREYEASMVKLFGGGSKVLMEAIMDDVCAGSGVDRSTVQTFVECLSTAKNKLTVPRQT